MGIRVTPDLKIRLSDSETSLQLIPFEGKEYAGAYLQAGNPTVSELSSHKHTLMDALQKSLPDVRTDMLQVVVFPQAFLG